MKLNSTLALSLLAFAPHAAALKQSDGSARRRMLARAEANGAATAKQRQLLHFKNGNGKVGGGNGKGNGTRGGGVGGSNGGDRPTKTKPKKDTDAASFYNGSHSRGKGIGYLKSKPHSAFMDENNAGMTADAIEYYYGDSISVTFDITNDLVPLEVQLGLNMDNIAQWKVGLFMRMADPQDGAVPPIVSVGASITDATSGRKLQKDNAPKSEPAPPSEPQEPITGQGFGLDIFPELNAPSDTPEDPTAPSLNYLGSATFTASDTSPKILDPIKYGDGIDAYLISETGAAIVGPVTFYMLPTSDMLAAAEVKAIQGKGLVSGLKKYNHANTAKGKYGKGGSTAGGAKGNPKKAPDGASVPDAAGLGFGSGSDGGQIIGTAEALADYVLEADAEYYTLGDEVTVVYNIGPDALADERRRRLQKRNKKKVGNGNGGGIGYGNGGGNGNGNGGGNSDPATTEAPPTTTEATTTEATQANDGSSSSTSATAPATATTTTTEEEVDQSAGDIDLVGSNLESQPTIDESDITLFSIGVFMRMAHPQGGALAPIYSVPFCPTAEGEECGLSTDQLESGEFVFSTSAVYNLEEYGTGYDIWVLNGAGGGVAGPISFYVDEPAP